MVENGAWCVGTPDDLVELIHRLDESSGGFGGLMVQATEFGTREQVLHSYELIARYVMPQFQGSVESLNRSQQHATAIKSDLADFRPRVMQRAASDYDAQRATRS